MGEVEPGSQAESFAERLLEAVLGAQEVQALYLGHQLGWYQGLAEGGPQSSEELAARTDSSERYAREWLEHQAACGYVTVEDLDAEPSKRRFALPPAHAEVLLDGDSPMFTGPLARFVAAAGQNLDRLAEAYRTGGGLSWAEMGDGPREAQADANRPLLLHQLGKDLLPGLPEIHSRLSGGARVADIGCGGGWSSIGIAAAYPSTTVDGFDLDELSIEMARRNAAEAGVDARVRFHHRDAASAGGDYDVVFAFECVHDLPDPVGVLSAMREMAGPDGAVVVMDERVGERFQGLGDEVERLMYGYSLMCCLPDGMSTSPSAGTGTVMRPQVLDDYARRAGFESAEALPLEHDFFRFYRLHIPSS